MARLIHGDDDTFDYLTYGGHDNRIERYVSSRIDNLERASSTLFRAGEDFISKARESFERFYDSEAVRYARAATRAVRSIWGSDEIRVFEKLEDIQSMKPRQQRLVMANPMIRALYLKQKIEGYAESYVDNQPGAIGAEHYDYRRLMNGVVEECGEDGEDWRATTYDEELHDGDDFLTPDEQVDALLTNDRTLIFIRQRGKDPTSRFNADLL